MDTNSIRELLNDFEKYIPEFGHHSGNLKQHSLWVSYYIQEALLFPELSPLGHAATALQKHMLHSGKPINYEKILIISSLLHDIGKGGDQVYTYMSKPDHELTGYKYLEGELVYMYENGNILNTRKLFKSLGLTRIQVDIVNFLVLHHWDLGKLVIELDYIDVLKYGSMRDINKLSKEIAKRFCSIVTRKTQITKAIVLMQFILCCADVMGAQPYCGESQELELFPLSKYPEFTKDCFKTSFSVYHKYYYAKIIKNVFPEICKILDIKK
jgi:hypothetical protein